MLRTMARQFQQVYLNFPLNAVQAPSPDGVISISVKPRSKQIEFFVSHDSIGNPQENLEKVFQPSFTTKPMGRDTGLGLALCRQIIVSLGGKIDVESLVGEGTTFRVVLPTVRETLATQLATSRG